MLKFKSIKLAEHYPGIGRGMRPGYKCSVELQIGEKAYDTIKIDLSDDEVREVIGQAVAKAVERVTFDPATIDVIGTAGVPYPDEPAAPEPPEFAEVEEAPAAPVPAQEII